MFVNIHRLKNILNQFPLDNIPSYAELCFDETGFTLRGKTPEETKELNKKWKNYLVKLNKIAGVEEYLTISEIAKHLQVSVSSVHKIIKEQDPKNPVLPYIETSIGKRIKSSDYLEFLHKCYQPSASFSPQNTRNLDE